MSTKSWLLLRFSKHVQVLGYSCSGPYFALLWACIAYNTGEDAYLSSGFLKSVWIEMPWRQKDKVWKRKSGSAYVCWMHCYSRFGRDLYGALDTVSMDYSSSAVSVFKIRKKERCCSAISNFYIFLGFSYSSPFFFFWNFVFILTVFKGAFETEPNYLHFCYFDLCGPCRYLLISSLCSQWFWLMHETAIKYLHECLADKSLA